MDLLGTGINALVVGAVGLLLARFARGSFDELDKRFEGRFDELDKRFEGRFAELDKRFEGRFVGIDRRFEAVEGRLDRIEARIDGMRSDLTQVALAVGARPRATNS